MAKRLSLDALEPLFDKIEKLSKVQRILIAALVFILLSGGFVWGSYMPKFQKLKELDKKHDRLKKNLRTAKLTARSLPKFKEKMEAAQVQFEQAKQKLPEKKEIPSLLSDISQSGQDAGLEFLLFQPVKEVSREFFAEIPVQMRVTGHYHNVGVFFDKVAQLPRIVNIRNIQMTNDKTVAGLVTTCTAVTYRFVEPEPPPPPRPKVAKRKKKK